MSAVSWLPGRALGKVDGMATKKYTVTLPEELAEAIRAEVGPGGFSRYVTQAIEHQRERERLHEAVRWWESEYGEITEAELAEVEAEHRDLERQHAERADAREGSEQPYERKRAAA
ncbi:hypothetical protein GCM10017557_59020 [Streptomyces aurantiacus]|uniref:CopG family transcriptional regulator n=2 Tax=Streptomyces aurantiacus TaxID=47760 RepID=A0A7G1P5E4_9ACTN|nr:hypothetical protein GCM10017557_59020 [Streptomyces aurantiacus]